MAPSGQGTLVDVCDGKAHPQHLCGPRLGYTPRGGLSCGLEGSHAVYKPDTARGASKCCGWDGLRDHHARRGN